MKSTLPQLLECCNWNDINFNYDYNMIIIMIIIIMIVIISMMRYGGYCLILIYPPKIACVDMVSITLFC